MRRLGGWLLRARGLFGGRRSDQDLRDQIAAHLDEATDEYLRQGLSPADARRAARLGFGSVVQAEETYRDVRGRWLNDLTRDLRYGIRSLRRNPAFTVVAVVSLAVGIGANTAIFTLVNGLLLRPRPVANADQLVELYTGDRDHPYETTSYPSYVELRDRNQVFSGLAAYTIRQFTLTDPNHVEQLWGEAVTGNYFDVLGVQPHHGRALAAADDLTPGATPRVVIGHALWQRRFNSDPGLIGQAISINRQTVIVVGVAPPQFTGMIRGLSSDVWIPVTAMPLLEPSRADTILSRESRWLALIGRLETGTTVEQARARFDLLSREMQASHPDEWMSRNDSTGAVRELFVTVLRERDTRIHPDMWAGAWAAAALLVVIVNIVLLVACMNLANMLLARAVLRRKEVAIRLALGASRWRLVRQLITESVLVSLMAGLAGVVLTIWLLNLLLASIPALPEGIRVAVDLHLDWRVLAYTLGFSTVTGVLFGLAPAVHSSRAVVSTILKDESSAVTGGYRGSRWRMALVVTQVACSFLLLVGAGLVLRSLENLRPTRLGFSSDRILVAPLTLDEIRYDRGRSQDFYRRLIEGVSALPGVQAVSLSENIPGGFLGRARRGTEIEGYVPGPDESVEVEVGIVGPHYFTNMKVPVVQGRDFDERDVDGAPCVAIVNEAFSRRYFPTERSPLGRHLAKFDAPPAPRKQMCEIVGVIRDDAWQSLETAVQPFHALPVLQLFKRRMALFVHTAGDPASQTTAVRRAVQTLDPAMAVNDVRPLAEYFSATLYPFRVLALVMGTCGVMALLLATVGVYGIVAFAAVQRTREVGIRMALGALHHDIMRMMMGQGMMMVAAGLAIGLLLSVALTGVLTSVLFESGLLFGLSPTDALTFACVTALLAVVAALACYVPARRAANVDPLDALRYE